MSAFGGNSFGRYEKKFCYAIHDRSIDKMADGIEDKTTDEVVDKVTDKVVAIPLFSAENMKFFTPAPNKVLSFDFIKFRRDNGKNSGKEVMKRPKPDNNLEPLNAPNALDAMVPLVLKPNQLAALEICLKRFELTGSVILCAYTGFGKTITASVLATNLLWLPAATTPTFLPLSNQKTVGVVIVAHRDLLKQQWKETLEKKFGAKPTTCLKEFLTECSTLTSLNCSLAREPILITSPIKLSNELIALKNETGRNCWLNVKLCIVDEVHAVVNETGIAALLKINCDFSLGLSATPYRPDARDVCLTKLYGENIVRVKMEQTPDVIKEVYVWRTQQEPPRLKLKGRDRVLWNSVIDFQCFKRNRMEDLYDAVAKIHKSILGPGKTVLFLTKRVVHAKVAADAFMSRNLTVTNLCEETMKKSSKSKTLGKATGNAAAKQMKMEKPKVSDVIVATYLKAGEGFDVKSICGLVLASDTNIRFIQVLGRIRCFNNPFNFVIDIVDNSKQLDDHFRERFAVYKQCEYKLQTPFLTPQALAKHVTNKHGKQG